MEATPMGGDGEFGRRVLRTRTRAKVTQARLAQLAGIDRVTLARIEGGGDTLISTAIRLAEALAMHAPDNDLVWLLTGSGDPGAGRVGTTVRTRRSFLRVGAATAASLALPAVEIDLEQLSAPGIDLAGAEAVTDGLLAQWYTVAPAMLLPPTLGHLGSLREYLHEHLSGPPRLLRATGRAALLAGRLRIKLRQLDKAADDFAQAGALADDIGDAELRALVLAARAGMYSTIAAGPRPGDQSRALALAEASVAAVSPAMPGRLLASALGRRAEEYALAGQATAALRDLAAAERALDEPDDGGMYFGARTLAELGAIRGNVELLLGENHAAVKTLDATLAGMDPQLMQWRAAALADQGAALARAGQLDAAVDRLERALQMAQLAGDHVARVAGVRKRDLAGREREPAVRRFDERLSAIL